jgi:alkaline phosphatase
MAKSVVPTAADGAAFTDVNAARIVSAMQFDHEVQP